MIFCRYKQLSIELGQKRLVDGTALSWICKALITAVTASLSIKIGS